MSFFKSKKFWIPLILVVVIVIFVYRNYAGKSAAPQYETVKVAQGPLVQTVEATGKITSLDDLSLRFEVPGTLGAINVKEGSTVKAGDLLASLRAADLNAAVAQAKANLDQKIAGANSSERAFYQAAVESAQADLNKTKADTANTVSSAEANVETARNNLQLAEGGESSQIVSQAYASAVALLQATVSKLDDALTQADNILGIDNTLANNDFENYLSISDKTKLNAANSNYLSAKDARTLAKNVIILLNTQSPHANIDNGLTLAEDALAKSNQLLTSVADVLIATPPIGTLTQSMLDTKKTIIETTRIGITTQYTSVINQSQTVSDAKNSYSTFSIAYNKAVNDLANAEATATSLVQMKQAAYDQAEANLQNKVEPTREVDLAPLRAALAQAIANRNKTLITAPIDGVVTKVNKKVGEFVSASEVAIAMLSPHFEVEVDIPETDVAKIKVGDAAIITLDAFGDEVKFTGKTVSIEPASTDIQDVVYYQVKISLDDTDKPIKSGMTANITINTDSRDNAIYIPSRAVRTDNAKYVRVLKNGQPEDRPVVLGLKADDGKVEVLSGLSEGEDVIVSTVGGN